MYRWQVWICLFLSRAHPVGLVAFPARSIPTMTFFCNFGLLSFCDRVDMSERIRFVTRIFKNIVLFRCIHILMVWSIWNFAKFSVQVVALSLFVCLKNGLSVMGLSVALLWLFLKQLMEGLLLTPNTMLNARLKWL